MYQYHEELKALKSAHSHSSDDLNNKKKDLEDLKRRNNVLERDVERYNNKKQYEKEITNLTLKRYWMVCGEKLFCACMLCAPVCVCVCY